MRVYSHSLYNAARGTQVHVHVCVYEKETLIGYMRIAACINCICETPVLNIGLFEYLHSSQKIANLQTVDPILC